MTDVDQTSSTGEQRKSSGRWRKFRRLCLVLCVLFLLLAVVGWMLLPRIAEKVMSGMIADAGLEQTDFKVREIGWNSAVVEKVVFADGVWRLTADEVTVHYDPFDLMKGRVDHITLVRSVCTLDFPAEEKAAEEETDIEEPTEPSEGEDDEPTSYAWMHQLPVMVEQIGGLTADGLDLTIKRGGRIVRMTMDVSLDSENDQQFGVWLKCPDFNMNAGVATEESVTVITAELDEVLPDSFLHLIETALDLEDRILPEGFTVSGASLSAELLCEGDVMSPLTVTGALERIKYDGGDKPVNLETESAKMQLTQNFSGGGFVFLSGGLDKVSLPLDPSADFVLSQSEGATPGWWTRIEWGEEKSKITGGIEKFELEGTYNERPVSLDDIHLDLVLADDQLNVQGAMSNAGTVLPLKYAHEMTGDDEWQLLGELTIGPIKHDRPMPLLSSATDLFDDITMRGESHSTFSFKVGAYLPFEGKLVTRLSDVGLNVSEGLVTADGLNGTWELHLIPLSDTDPTQPDPSYYTLNLTSKKLHVDSKESLDFDLDHVGEAPVSITGKGRFGGDVAVLDGEMKQLNLHGENGGVEIDLLDTQVEFHMKGDLVTAKGETKLKDNVLPFTYRHVKKDEGEGWNLTGQMEIKAADLKTPVDNAAILIEAMKDKSLTGKLAVKMDFTKGSEQDFDGVLTASVENGTLKFTTEDGPVIEGIKGGIRLSSMKNKQTAGFHRVTATKMTAFDMAMTNLRVDYQMLPNGDIKLNNVGMSALGGNVWLDPFVLPGDDKNYQFKVRMKRIDIAEMAKLFPEFNGKISGRIDGLLPMQNINGDFMPQRGGMYLTPGSSARLRYDAGTKFSGGLDPKGREYQQMKMVEDSLKNLELRVLSIRLFDPRDKDKAVVLRLEGKAPTVQGSPPIILNINGFKPDDDTVDFFDLLLKHRDKLNFGL
ncbi:hypothetical protein NT6N_30680 [Oceaniferula spumae]|uniref:Dicarboxylate transport domain-containing protein n=1 Tax=Oceaniferula spumae TaxID=2979115 RepID=A0AAT9FPX7_9BACT